MRNPFYYGGIVSEKYFCNRENEIKELKKDILNGLNILIYAPRRFGKSSLVIHTLEKLKKEKKLKYIFVDLMGISSKEEFINEYFNAVAQSLEEPLDKVINFFKNVIKFRPVIRVTVDEYGRTKFHLEFSPEKTLETLEEVLDLPLFYAKKGRNICIVFDEFQEIEVLGIENRLRSKLQHHSNRISYIFMGSKKSILQKIFQDKKRAFYRSVKHFQIKEISEKDWIKFIQDRFKKTGKDIDKSFIKEIVTITRGFPYYTQQFAYELWENTEKEVDEQVFKETLKLIMEREEDLFATEWDNLTSNQKKVLKLIVEKNGQNLYDEHILAKYEIKVGSLRKIIQILMEKDIIDRRENRYYLQDPLFEYWLKQKIY
ncbi:MAG TPA: ATP-binding protein [Persephonella sp.]|uniref:Putative archaeal ATPase n=1 Tax=Persephonella marina (strain DSM 14350 / EX-H1) TaxID=123214 RepID=C0QPN2_PERMH|nr:MULTISPECIES: ATP-binding protein [Persephonella]ACO04910.1 putative archaeal ATPase [Persephonella marina EX-H1]HCB69757.1 ATP-binding protein [Persephonella sp.]